jgi:hypothetical protein
MKKNAKKMISVQKKRPRLGSSSSIGESDFEYYE